MSAALRDAVIIGGDAMLGDSRCGTSIPGLHLCGGVSGLPGRNAARAVLGAG